MDGKRLMARNVYQVFRCFRSTIRFSSILETHRLAWQGRPDWFGLVENSWPNKSSGRNSGTESKRLAAPLSIEFENRNNLRSFNYFTSLLLHFVLPWELSSTIPCHLLSFLVSLLFAPLPAPTIDIFSPCNVKRRMERDRNYR